jgi:DNA-directed RNA polymerase sigma subunit (sigma70/sigma32)
MENELFEKPRSEWERLIDEWIFSERDRKILKRRLLDGITHEKIAEEFDMSDRQIRAIVKKSVAKLSMKV